LCYRYLTSILENKCPIDPNDYEDFFIALSSTSNGITAMNDFLGQHFTDLVNNVKDGKNIAKIMFSILASKVSTDSEIENVTTFFYFTLTVKLWLLQLIPNLKLYSRKYILLSNIQYNITISCV